MQIVPVASNSKRAPMLLSEGWGGGSGQRQTTATKLNVIFDGMHVYLLFSPS